MCFCGTKNIQFVYINKNKPYIVTLRLTIAIYYRYIGSRIYT